VDECFKKHINMESSFAESRRRQEEEFEKAIEKLRVEGMQTYTTTKIKMENDIQNLEKCYEEMKALYQLNTEKLDYNLKILKEKKEENHENHEELKKKESILNTRYRNLRSQYEKEDQKFKDTNKQLTADYKRITRQFKELQRKFKHFEKSDLERYNEIQAMNEKEVQELKDKIIKCDKVIHNQQLGLDWVAFNAPDEDKPEEKPLVIENEDDEEQETQLAVTEQKLSEILDILIEEADFIFDDKMREELERASQEEKLKEKLEILKKTLSIESVEELNLFIDDLANNCKYVSEKEKHSQHE
jgi:dynein regulatry complex protein 1